MEELLRVIKDKIAEEQRKTPSGWTRTRAVRQGHRPSLAGLGAGVSGSPGRGHPAALTAWGGRCSVLQVGEPLPGSPGGGVSLKGAESHLLHLALTLLSRPACVLA